jgi:hypothetical protein
MSVHRLLALIDRYDLVCNALAVACFLLVAYLDSPT